MRLCAYAIFMMLITTLLLNIIVCHVPRIKTIISESTLPPSYITCIHRNIFYILKKHDLKVNILCPLSWLKIWCNESLKIKKIC